MHTIVQCNKNSTVFVASGEKGDGGGGCPTIKAAEDNARMRDDYYGRIAISKSLLKKIF